MSMGALQPLSSRAQVDGFDTTYVNDFTRRLTGRLYLSTKYNALRIGGQGNDAVILRPNSKVNMGIGASYRALTLNIGFGIPFVNRDQEVRGRTRYIDAQANIHTQRWATNLFLQVFAGYYLASHDLHELGWQQPTQRPYREDLVEFNLGVSSLRILNDRRFSYRAAFSQDAWQRRSQGSWLVGGYSTYFSVRGDSALVPTALWSGFEGLARMERGRFMDLGPMGGYVHTFVYRQHWFATVSGAVGAGLSTQHITYPTAEGSAEQRNSGLGWHAQVRAAVGYNSRHRYVGIGFNQENIGYLLPDQQHFRWSVGNVRLNLVQRFNRRVPQVDRGIRWFRKKVKEPLSP